ncbi:glycosyltransferase family 39 protein [Aggregatilineales bacterium SYSU G02658]
MPKQLDNRLFDGFAVLMLMILALGLALYTRQMIMHWDEFGSYDFTRYPLIEVALMQHDIHAPLWWIQFWGWWRAFGQSEAVGRWNSLLIAFVTLALAYQVGKQAFRSPLIGLGAMAVTALHPFVLRYGLDMRPYPLVVLLALMSVWALLRWLNRPTAARARLYGLVVALMLYTHYYMALLALAQGIYALLARRSRAAWIQMAQAVGVVLVLFGPWLPILVRHYNHLRGVVRPLDARVALSPYPTVPTTPETVQQFIDLNTLGLGAGLLLIVGLAFVLRRWRMEAGLALAMFALPTAAVFLLNVNISLMVERYMVFVVWGPILLLMAGWALLDGRLRWLRLPVIALCVGGVALLAPTWHKVYPPVREVWQSIYTDWQAGDVLIMDNFDDTHKYLRAGHYLPAGFSGFETIAPEEALGHARVWHVTDNIFDATVNAHLDFLKQHFTIVRVYGECNARRCFVGQLLEPLAP